MFQNKDEYMCRRQMEDVIDLSMDSLNPYNYDFQVPRNLTFAQFNNIDTVKKLLKMDILNNALRSRERSSQIAKSNSRRKNFRRMVRPEEVQTWFSGQKQLERPGVYVYDNRASYEYDRKNVINNQIIYPTYDASDLSLSNLYGVGGLCSRSNGSIGKEKEREKRVRFKLSMADR